MGSRWVRWCKSNPQTLLVGLSPEAASTLTNIRSLQQPLDRIHKHRRMRIRYDRNHRSRKIRLFATCWNQRWKIRSRPSLQVFWWAQIKEIILGKDRGSCNYLPPFRRGIWAQRMASMTARQYHPTKNIRIFKLRIWRPWWRNWVTNLINRKSKTVSCLKLRWKNRPDKFEWNRLGRSKRPICCM